MIPLRAAVLHFIASRGRSNAADREWQPTRRLVAGSRYLTREPVSNSEVLGVVRDLIGSGQIEKRIEWTGPRPGSYLRIVKCATCSGRGTTVLWHEPGGPAEHIPCAAPSCTAAIPASRER